MKKLKLLFSIALLGLLGSCYLMQPKPVQPHLNAKDEALKFIDILKKIEADTIIGYYDGCSGCIQGIPRPYYVFWVKSKKCRVMKFTDYKVFESIEISLSSLDYIIPRFKLLQKEELEKANYIMSHGRYEQLMVYVEGDQLEYSLRHYEREINEAKVRVIVLDKLRSRLFGIPNWKWKPLGSEPLKEGSTKF